MRRSNTIRLTESRLRNMIREAVAGYLNEYYNSDTGTCGNGDTIITGRGRNFGLRKNPLGDRIDLEKDKDPRNKRFELTKESKLRNMIRESIRQAIYEGNDTAETVGPFVSDRASFLNKRTKPEQIESDWEDLRDFYPYGGEVPYDRWQAEEDELNGDNWNQSQYPPSYEIDRFYDLD